MKKPSSLSMEETELAELDNLAIKFGYNRSALLRLILKWNVRKIKTDGIGYLFGEKSQNKYLERS